MYLYLCILSQSSLKILQIIYHIYNIPSTKNKITTKDDILENNIHKISMFKMESIIIYANLVIPIDAEVTKYVKLN